MSGVFLVLASFLASAVEMVEALTIVMAAGVTRGWRSSLVGVGAALVVLAAIFEREREATRSQGTIVRAGLDWYAFKLCFIGVRWRDWKSPSSW